MRAQPDPLACAYAMLAQVVFKSNDLIWCDGACSSDADSPAVNYSIKAQAASAGRAQTEILSSYGRVPVGSLRKR